ncbi:hypothetical protein NEOLEDRAFT_1175197 [Neolentinus lepideus HHB14362 ss-1]|uniref:Uncharacterized protein n=1 Tax=Neolentinus lepideus HHB14362 ss-1 TaxID=1314782 RepID=A0A165VDH5_9AGAM|nr:hypothetical protein NEOLEDRAFT_1175197 [Neolentinus lepideus HHB14362 ss-1]
MGRRRTTVHDLASLRVHPDGTRTPSAPSISTTNATLYAQDSSASTRGLRPRLAKYTIQDARGNIVARDGGGLGRVPYKYPVSATRVPDDAESFDLSAATVRLDGANGDEFAEGSEAVPEKKRKGREVKDPRAKKRRKFVEDLSFLDSRSPSLSLPQRQSSPSNATRDVDFEVHPATDRDSGEAGATSFVLPTPSSDLLKAIHHFASAYYSSKGQLIDASRDARRAKKVAKLKRLQELSNLDKFATPESPSDRGLDEEKEDSSDEESGKSGTSMRSWTGSPTPGPSSTPKTDTGYKGKTSGRRSRKRRDQGELRRDMYKAFDGSALVALGMLVQEHVAGLLTPDVPEGWEEEMERYFGALDGATDERGCIKQPKKKRKAKAKKAHNGKEEKRVKGRKSMDATPSGLTEDHDQEKFHATEDVGPDDSQSSVQGNLFDGDIPNPGLVIDNNEDDSDYVP